MTDGEVPGVVEAARLLDDMTQQIIPVPPLLDQDSENEPAKSAPKNARFDGHVW